MDWISDWIRQIILIIFIATFIDLLLPSTSLERYVKLIMGLIIIVSILQPVLQLVLSEDKWSKFSAIVTPSLATDHYDSLEKIKDNSSQLTNVQQEEIRKQFQTSITTWIEQQVAQKYDVKVVSAKVTADFEQSTPVIQRIDVEGLKAESSKSTGAIKPIEPVIVSKEHDKKPSNGQEIKLQQAIQSFIGSAWNIRTNQVIVQIHSS
jgi:stage III sporulation protein AF